MSSISSPPLDRPENVRAVGYVPTLDGWRAIAVLLVIGVHCSVMLKNNGSFVATNVERVLSHAGIGVDIFFSLSGFLITRLLLIEREKTDGIRLGSFYVRRAFRILPPLIAYLAVVLVLATLGPLAEVSLHEVAASLLFARNYVDGSWYTAHFWSLSVEEHFYLFIPALIALLRPKALLQVSLAIVVVCIAVRWYELSYPSSFGMLPQFRTENRVDALLWGSILAQLERRSDVRARLQAAITGPRVLVLAIVAAVLLAVVEPQWFRRTLVAVVLPLPIMYTVFNPASLMGRVLEWQPMRYIGRLSFSLYIWQMLFLVPFARPLGIWQNFPLAVLLPFLAAFVSYRFIEKPFIRRGHLIAGSSAPAAPVGVR